MNEERRPIPGYEEFYEITRSGRIITKRRDRALFRNGDEYGYTYVHLMKNGERKLFRTYEIWKRVFCDIDKAEYKGK